MRALLITCLLLLPLAACKKDGDDTAPPEGDTDTDTDTDTDIGEARWSFLVFMNGDNDLESYVFHDLNELEEAGSGDGVQIVVQADRAEGYATNGGDWTGTRRYHILPDDNDHQVVSELVEDMGEQDMGDPAVLADFLDWATTTYPAEHVALVMWDHGDGWTFTDTPTLPGISYDDESGNGMSIAEGEFQAALEGWVAENGKLDVIAFDACSMASWEVGHALKDLASTIVASEATLGMEGLQYNLSVQLLKDEPDTTAAELADHLAAMTVQEGGEWTMAAIDLERITPLSEAIDALAQAALGDPQLQAALLEARDVSQGTDSMYPEWYLDIGSLAGSLQDRDEPELSAAGAQIEAALQGAVLGSYGGGPYTWAGGLNILFDYGWLSHLRSYQNGEGATWSQDTHWDELLFVYAQDD